MLNAQTFPSGSTGADGALNITAAGVTTFTAKPVGGGNVYNFTTINIAVGSTLKLSGSVFPLPLYFLATGAVTISGTIDLSGQSSVPAGTSGELSSELIGPTTPGAGGYGGGSAAYGGNAALPGLGPGAGGVGGCGEGSFTGNQYLVPLVGGSGGGGSTNGSGGAGGGALLIASSVSITVLGTITAAGGSGETSPYVYPGGGAGGGIRLVAPTIAGNGTLTAAGGPSCGSSGIGVIRMEAFTNSFSGTTTGTLYLATPFNLFVPASTGQPSVMVTSIGGVAVPASPTGSFTMPDVTLNSSSPLTINITATNIPAGTTATVYFDTESNPSQSVVSTPLAATSTAGVTTATATVTLKSGYSKGFVVATWTQ
jgi:hypothetical protein